MRQCLPDKSAACIDNHTATPDDPWVDRWAASLLPVYREDFAEEGVAAAGKAELVVEAGVAVAAAVAVAVAELVVGVGNRELVDMPLAPGSLVVERSDKPAAHCKVLVAEGSEPIAGNFRIAYGFAGRGKLTGPGKVGLRHLAAHRAVRFVVDFAGIPVDSIDWDKNMPADSGMMPFQILSFLLNNPASPRNLLP